MPDFQSINPGEILSKDFLKPMGVSEYKLAKAMNVPPRRINEAGVPRSGVRARRNPRRSSRSERSLGLRRAPKISGGHRRSPLGSGCEPQ